MVVTVVVGADAVVVAVEAVTTAVAEAHLRAGATTSRMAETVRTTVRVSIISNRWLVRNRVREIAATKASLDRTIQTRVKIRAKAQEPTRWVVRETTGSR